MIILSQPTIKQYFDDFGLDIDRFSLEVCQPIDQLLPWDFGQLRSHHIRHLMGLVHPKSTNFHALQTMLAPRDLL